MNIVLTKEWMNRPRGEFLQLNEMVAERLISQKVAKLASPAEVKAFENREAIRQKTEASERREEYTEENNTEEEDIEEHSFRDEAEDRMQKSSPIKKSR